MLSLLAPSSTSSQTATVIVIFMLETSISQPVDRSPSISKFEIIGKNSSCQTIRHDQPTDLCVRRQRRIVEER